jgi:hypothetical protein
MTLKSVAGYTLTDRDAQLDNLSAGHYIFHIWFLNEEFKRAQGTECFGIGH